MSIRRLLGRTSLAIAVLTSTAFTQTDPLIEQMVDEVSKARLTSHVQTLENFGTRYTTTSGNGQAMRWLYRYFRDTIQIPAIKSPFPYGGGSKNNVIATITGKLRPQEIVVISGHLDSTSEDRLNLAPGADDAASVCAAVLETAEIFKNYQWDRTIEFICYNAEEQGRIGSIAVANDYIAQGKNVIAVINADMIGYWPDGWNRDVDIAYDPLADWLADHVVSVGQRYVPGVPIAKKLTGACRDDHVSFTAVGIPAITTMDCWEAHNGGINGETTPHYHKTTDTLATLNMDCMTQVVQIDLAALAELAGPLGLTADATSVSAASGGAVTMALSAGLPQASRNYFMLGSISGTSPGLPLGNGVVLPLNWDLFMQIVMNNVNGPYFSSFYGPLDTEGAATAVFNVPPGVLVGLEGLVSFHFAYPLLSPKDFASNAVRIDIDP